MGRKAILEKRLQRLQAKRQKLKERALASQDAAEVRSINEQLEDVNAEIGETEEEIRAIDGEGGEPAPFNDPDDPVNDPAAAPQQRGLAPIPGAGDPVGTTVVRGAYGQHTNMNNQPDNNDPYGTIEYRTAFKNYVQRWNTYSSRTDSESRRRSRPNRCR